MKKICYFTEDIEFNLQNPDKISEWISIVIANENHTLESLNYIFCSDPFLLSINQEYLNHDFFTDIITFDQSEKSQIIEGEIYISIDRVRENSLAYSKSFNTELHRVMVHGVLHLLGFKDGSDIEKEQMRKKEEACLSLQRF
jgi:rRNA maturation RNase YbeY